MTVDVHIENRRRLLTCPNTTTNGLKTADDNVGSVASRTQNRSATTATAGPTTTVDAKVNLVRLAV